MTIGKHHTFEEKQDILAEYTLGGSVEDLCATHRISQMTLCFWRKKYHVPPRSKKAAKKWIRKEVLLRYPSMSARKIATIFGVSKSTVANIVCTARRNGIVVRKHADLF